MRMSISMSLAIVVVLGLITRPALGDLNISVDLAVSPDISSDNFVTALMEATLSSDTDSTQAPMIGNVLADLLVDTTGPTPIINGITFTGGLVSGTWEKASLFIPLFGGGIFVGLPSPIEITLDTPTPPSTVTAGTFAMSDHFSIPGARDWRPISGANGVIFISPIDPITYGIDVILPMEPGFLPIPSDFYELTYGDFDMVARGVFVIPEPTSAAMLLLGGYICLAGGLGRRVRRNQNQFLSE